MNKFFSIGLAMAIGAVVTSKAEIIVPEHTFAEDFSAKLPEGKYLPDGWVTYGTGNKVGEAFESYFGSEGEAPFYRSFSIDGVSAAWSCSTFKYVADADEWLVTPVIHVTSDEEVLQLKAVSSGAYATNRYRVLISESGQDSESFGRMPVLNTTLIGWETRVRDNTSYVAINGYAGKDICLAFVNKSKDAGLLGFTDILMAPYTVEVTNITPAVLPTGSTTSIAANVNIHTPSAVPGLTARLETNSGIDKSVDIDSPIDINGARVLVSFDDILVPEAGVEYTITITPKMDGAKPTVVTGEIGTPSTSYPAVAVIEEFTGTWCSNCPRGTAFMNYYHDHYNGQNGRIKAVGIALHSTNDPMLMTDDSYINTAYSVAGAKGYPSAFFNRTTLGDPSDAYLVEETAQTRSNSTIRIKRVNYEEGSPVKVDFEIENSYNMKNMNQRVAMVIVENNVRAADPDDYTYWQVNGLSGQSQLSVENTYGPELWPYFQLFCEGSQYIEDIAYQHVARGIYPDYYGQLFDNSCQAEVPVELSMSMPMPEQVDKPENTAVVLLLLDGNNGKTISATEVSAADYNSEIAGVDNTVVEETASMFLNGRNLTVIADNASVLEIYTTDGRMVLGKHVTPGVSSVDVSMLSGIVIVSLTDESGYRQVRKFKL